MERLVNRWKLTLKMHDLFVQVLTKKDLSKAGDLFSVDDQEINEDMTEVIHKIREIITLSGYKSNPNDQSVVEICITRVTSAIRETGSIENHAEALVALLESCLSHNLSPTGKDEDPPHGKIASDVLSCIFLNYTKREVMKLALPVAVKFLHKGNRELSRNLSSYLSLSAISHVDLLAKHIKHIIDSIIAGNYLLVRVLPQVYDIDQEAIHGHVMALASLLPQCDTPEKISLLSLLVSVARNQPSLLEASLPQLCDCLSVSSAVPVTLQLLAEMAAFRAQLLADYTSRIKEAAETSPMVLNLAALVMGRLGQLDIERGQEALDFLVCNITKAENHNIPGLLRETAALCGTHPALLTDRLIAKIEPAIETAPSVAKTIFNQMKAALTSGGSANHKPGGVGLKNNSPIKSKRFSVNLQTPPISGGHSGFRSSIGGFVNLPSSVIGAAQIHPVNTNVPGTYSGNSVRVGTRPKHGDASKSTPKLSLKTGGTTVSIVNRSMNWLNAVHFSNGILNQTPGTGPKNLSRFGSSHQVTREPHGPGIHNPNQTRSYTAAAGLGSRNSLFGSRIHSSAVSGTGFPPPRPSSIKSISGSFVGELDANSSATVALVNSRLQTQTPLSMLPSLSSLAPSPPPSLTMTDKITTANAAAIPDSLINSTSNDPFHSLHGPVVRRNNPNTLPGTGLGSGTGSSLNPNGESGGAAAQRISVFEPYVMQDAVKHFCDKHLDKIKAYMERLGARLPLPVKCTIEERKAKKHAKLHFTCQGKSEHCLYQKTLFTLKTKHPRLWIHLMFLALQARSTSALSTRDPSVSSLKNCWDILKYDNKSFLTLVTSAFPSSKDQDNLMHELQQSRFFDVFEFNAPLQQWNCFLCNHPEKAQGFVHDNQTLMEGQLKEKKNKWLIFRRWRTRYFTLSGAHLSYQGSKTEPDAAPIEVNQIRSVKVGRTGRSIPKAFEIFTGDKTYVLKAKDGKNAEEWVQCLSVAVASSHARDNPSRPLSQHILPSQSQFGLRTIV